LARRRKINEFFQAGEAPPTAREAPREEPPKPDREAIELAAKLAAEKAVAMLAQRLLREVEECRSMLERIESRLEKLEGGGTRKGQALQERRKRSRLEEKVEEYLDKNRFLLLSEARQRMGSSPVRVREAAENVGALSLELEGDVALILLEHLEELEALMKEAKTPDPSEAAEKMGPYKRLFEKLRRSGLVYFDSARGYWRMLR